MSLACTKTSSKLGYYDLGSSYLAGYYTFKKQVTASRCLKNEEFRNRLEEMADALLTGVC